MARQAATRKLCEDCGKAFYNLPAHLEECPGVIAFERAEFQCAACLRVSDRSEWCDGRWMARLTPATYRAPTPNPL